MGDIPALKMKDKVAKIPIIQGGMGVGISLSNLASAVAKEGAIGVISAAEIGMIEEDDFFINPQQANERALRKEIKRAREKAEGGIIGINIMVAMSEFYRLCEVAIEEQADIIFAGAGLPLDIPYEKLKGSNTAFGVIVSSDRACKLIFRYWDRHYKDIPDCVVVEGPMAGGHLGFKPEQLFDPDYALENIVPPIIEAVKPFEKKYSKKVPVVAAGGIYTGEDIYRFIDEIGVDGVQMGTRFVATHECDADVRFKEAYIKAKKEDVVIIKSPVGLPGRAIKNKFLEEVEKGKKQPFKCIWQCLKGCDYKKAPYCITQALVNAQKGRFAGGFAFAGANVYRVDRIVSVKELIQELIDGYISAKRRAGKH
ncbi:NAD(P)H-dependent flavin oxidoreductase [Hippea jasoniae]|uniref:NAD(P)H-dependent flavin oxidoreductase n=1 Tax=Hippea jasoniae TaxID=944479 RepID=UPI0005529B03|nr:nitronate monooxygenase [Hippea jasoniae]